MWDWPLWGDVMRLLVAGNLCLLVGLTGWLHKLAWCPTVRVVIAKQAAAGFPGLGNLKAEAMAEAGHARPIVGKAQSWA